MHGVVSGLSGSVPLICVSVFMPVLYCFDYYGLESESMMPLALFFIKIALAIWGLFWFYTNFGLFFL